MNPNRIYMITLEGCDDETVFEMSLNDSEAALLRMVADAANSASTYGCEPGMRVELGRADR